MPRPQINEIEMALDPSVTQTLRGLAEGTDLSMLDEIYGAFTASSVEYFANLRRAVAEKSADALGKAAHGLKGAAANIGAVQVAEIARELECLGNSGSITGAEALLTALETRLSRARLEIESLSPALTTK